MKKIVSLICAAAMFIGCTVTASAEVPVATGTTLYAGTGDVDNDGVISGHDVALVSRAIVEGDEFLTKAQVVQADTNSDGVIDQIDLNTIESESTIVLGDITKEGVRYIETADGDIQTFPMSTITVSWLILDYVTKESAGKNVDIPMLDFNLMDVNADMVVDTKDALCMIWSSTYCAAGYDYFEKGKRYLTSTQGSRGLYNKLVTPKNWDYADDMDFSVYDEITLA